MPRSRGSSISLELNIPLIPSIIFTILYVVLLIYFARASRTHPSYVYYNLTFFCAIQVAAFAIRNVLRSSTSATLIGLVVADNVLFAVGYFSLLYSAYILVLDRILVSDLPPPKNRLLKISQNRMLFLIPLLVGLVLTIVAFSNIITSDVTIIVNYALYMTGTAIFLLLTLLQTFQTIVLARSGISEQSQYCTRAKYSSGVRYGNLIFLIVSLLLLIRGAFAMAIVEVAFMHFDERFWYPFTVVTEFLVILLYTTKGLVPRRDELPSGC